MHKLTVTLRQHTPLIHFQHDQEGATLRASEVKPKLDRFLLENALGNNYDDCKSFLVGYDDKHPDALLEKFNDKQKPYRALNYKLSIKTDDNDRVNVDLPVQINNGKYTTTVYPLLLSNMGGKEDEYELMNFSFYKKLTIVFNSNYSELIKYIAGWIDVFFAQNNFGQRNSKGFGSFSVSQIDDDEIFWDHAELLPDTRYLSFKVSGDDKKKFERLFGVIDFYWKCLKSGVNYGDGKYIKAFLWKYLNDNGLTWEKKEIKETFDLTTGTERKENNNPVSFSRALLGCPDKFEYKNFNKTISIAHAESKDSDDFIARIPSPITFKPITLSDGKVNVYLLINEEIKKYLSSYKNKTFVFSDGNMTHKISINTESIDMDKLLKLYNSYLANDDDLYMIMNKDSFREMDESLFEKNSWFVPYNFRWDNILGNGVVRLFKTKSK